MYKEEGRIEKKKRKKDSDCAVLVDTKHVAFAPEFCNQLTSHNTSSHNSSKDSFESIGSLGSMGSEIRRVRTLPIPHNLFYLGLKQESIPEEEVNADIRLAVPCDLKGEFWLNALQKAEEMT